MMSLLKSDCLAWPLVVVTMVCWPVLAVAAEPTPPSQPTPEHAQAEAVLRAFFAAYETRDVESAMAQWSPESPEYATRKGVLEELFAATQDVKFNSLQLIRVRGDQDRLRVRFKVNVSGTDAKSGQPSDRLGILERQAALVRDNNRYRIWSYTPFGAEDPAFMERLMKATNAREVDRIIREEYDQPGDEYTGLYTAYFNASSPEDRLHLLKRDPYQAISTSQFVTNLNSASWSFVAKVSTEGESAIKAAGYYQQLAEEVARHIDDPISLAWCQLQRALIEISQGKWGEAHELATQALRQFETLEMTEGRGAANIVLGRIAMAQADPAAADKAFRAADQYYSVYVVLGAATRKTLGETWAIMRSELNRRMHQIRQQIRQGQWSDATALADQTAAEATVLYGPWHESQADILSMQTLIAICRGDFAAAREWAQSGLKVAEHLYPPSAFEIVGQKMTYQMLDDLAKQPDEKGKMITKSALASLQADQLRQDGRFTESLQKWDEAIADRQAVLGTKHLFLASAWEARAQTAWKVGDHSVALQNLNLACDIYRESQAMDPTYQRALRSRATLLASIAQESMLDTDLDAAVQAYQAALFAETRDVVGDHDAALELSWSQDDLKRIRQLTSEQRSELRGLQVSLDSLSTPSPKNAADVLEPLQTATRGIGTLLNEDSFYLYVLRKRIVKALRQVGAQDQALAQLTSLLHTLRQRGFEAESPHFAEVLGYMAACHLDRGEIRLAHERLQEASRADNLAGPNDATTYLALKKLEAMLARRLGDYPAAERSLFRALLVEKRELISPENPEYHSHQIPLVLDDAILNSNKASLLTYGALLNDLGDLYRDMHQLERASTVFQSVVKVAERLDEPQRSRVLKTALNNLGLAQLDLNQIDASLDTLQHSLDLESLRGTDSVEYAQTEANVASCLQSRGNFAEALTRYRHVVQVYQHDGNLDPGQWTTLNSSISLCEAALGNRSQACMALDQAMTAAMQVVRDVASFKSDGESSHARIHAVNLSRLWPGYCLGADPAEIEMGWNWQLQVRGLSLEQLKQTRMARGLLRDNPQIERQASRAALLRAEISDLALNPPDDLTLSAARERQARLTAELNSIISSLHQAMKQILPTVPRLTVEQLRAILPQESALIEFTKAPSPDWSQYRSGKLVYENQYYAWVLKGGPSAQPQLVSLGDADAIDEAIEDLREQLVQASRLIQESSEKESELEYCEAARHAYDLVITPLLPHVTDVTQWYVLPDGELHRIALETLVDENQNYFLERMRIAYLTTATELTTPKKHESSGTWVFAAPDYNLTVEKQLEIAKQPIDAGRQSGSIKSDPDRLAASTSSIDVRAARPEKGWPDLPFAAEELATVKETLSSTAYAPIHEFTGASAVEEALKAVHSPRVLHLATHGFFVEDLSQDDDTGTRGRNSAAVGLQRLMQQENPLLRNGIVLAGANRLGRRSEPVDRSVDDGWVTAEEVAALDLSGTELVVLSACETGLGEVRVGEGVAGLRQSFLHAGAQTLVTSLYRVPDESTQKMMKDFYQGLREGKTKIVALGDAQRLAIQTRRATHGAAHPFFWGSFILVGDPD